MMALQRSLKKIMKRLFHKTTISLLLKKNKDPTDKWSYRLMSLVLKRLITHLLAFASSSMFTLFAGPWGSHLIRWLRRPSTKLCGRFSLSSFRNWVLVINSAPGLDSYPYLCKCTLAPPHYVLHVFHERRPHVKDVPYHPYSLQLL